MDSRVVQLTSAAHKHGNLNIRACGKEFFPDDVFGSSSRAKGVGVPITLKVKGLTHPVTTDIPTDRVTARPRWIFRKRSWVKEFVRLNKLVAGNTVIIARIGNRTYEIRTDDSRIEFVKTKQPKEKYNSGVPMQEQLDLFETPYTNIHREYGIKISYPVVKDVTFAGGMKESVHRWFRLTPSYSPEVVRLLFKYLRCDQSKLVLDPFLGKGTTLIECQKLGYPGVGIEINPLLVKVSKLALEWDLDLERLTKMKAEFLRKIGREIDKNAELTCEEYCARNKVKLPIIHNPFRWWKNDVLRNLLVIRTLLKSEIPNGFRGPFWMALCGSALDCANVHRNHPTISFDDNHNREIHVLADFEEKLETIVGDLREVSSKPHRIQSNVILGNSVKDLYSILQSKVERVVTSPPYPNRFSYIHTTRPQLYFMEILDDVQAATEIDIDAVGGTWGRATSVLMKKEIRPQKEIADILDFRENLLSESLLMCNYATKYFNDMFEHIVRLKSMVRKGFRGAYVVGNSRLKKVEIHTEFYLARMFEKARFKVDEIMFFRRRGGKKKLYESAICVRV